jgi:hypothetical protein
LLRDDLRVSKDAWQDEEDDGYERLLTSRNVEPQAEIDDYFARL